MVHFIIVGHNYEGTPHELKYCNNDAKFYEYQAITMEADYSAYRFITRSELIMGMHNLMFKLGRDDIFYFCFSGYGTKIGQNNAIVLHDRDAFEIVYVEEIKSIVACMKCRTYAIFDCSFDDSKRPVFKVDNDIRVRKNVKFEKLGLEIPEMRTCLFEKKRSGESYMFASRNDYPAIELEGNGALTLMIKKSWQRRASLKNLMVSCIFLLREYQMYPYVEYKNTESTKIFKSNEQKSSVSKTDRRRITKTKRPLVEHESGKDGFRQYRN